MFKKTLFPLLLLIAAIVLITSILYTKSATKNRLSQVFHQRLQDSLNNLHSQYDKELYQMSRVSDSLQKIIRDHALSVSRRDSIIESLSGNVKRYSQKDNHCEEFQKQNRFYQKKIQEYNIREKEFSEREQKYITDIDSLKQSIARLHLIIDQHAAFRELIQSHHEIPILFILANSFLYYPADSSYKTMLLKAFDHRAALNSWEFTAAQIRERILHSSKNEYPGIKWIGEKAGCPFEAAYFLLQNYSYDPLHVTKEEIVSLLEHTIVSYPADFQLSSDAVQKFFNSESETLLRLKETISCLQQRLKL